MLPQEGGYNLFLVANRKAFPTFMNKHKVFYLKILWFMVCVSNSVCRLSDRGVGRGGSKGSDEPPFQTRFLKNYSYCYFNTNDIIIKYGST